MLATTDKVKITSAMLVFLRSAIVIHPADLVDDAFRFSNRMFKRRLTLIQEIRQAVLPV